MITMVLGGTRSGKSDVAESLVTAAAAQHDGSVTYLATMRSETGLGAGSVDGPSNDPSNDFASDSQYDEALATRIAAHRARRPAHWQTVEAVDDLPEAIRHATGVILLDSLGPWVAAQQGFTADIADLCQALGDYRRDAVVVSDEVGLGVVPMTEAGTSFRDALGLVNQRVAAIADRVLLAVAGRVLTLDAPPER